MKKIKKIKSKIIAFLSTAGVVCMHCSLNILAATNKIKDSKLYTGTEALLKDATIAAVAIEAAVTAFHVVRHGITLQNANEQEAPAIKKKMISTVIIGVIVILATAIVSLVFSYYI